MNSFFWLWLSFFIPQFNQVQQILSTNQERVYLHLDKNDCIAGDTLWYKAYVTADRMPYAPSTVYYVDLFNDSGRLLRDDKCILIDGVGEGQIKLPDTLKTNNYWIQAYTTLQYKHDSATIFKAPIVAYNPENYQKIPHYSFWDPYADTVDDYDRGINLYSNLLDSGIECNINASFPFNRWDRDLTLELKAGKQPTKNVVIKISKDHPRLHIRIDLSGVFGNLHIRLLDQDKLLSQEQINIPYWNSDSVTIRYDSLNTNPHGDNLWSVIVHDSSACNLSVSITDADRVSKQPINILNMANMMDTVKAVDPNRLFAVDDHYLELNGYARNQKGDPFKASSLAAIIGQDSSRSVVTIPLRADGYYSYKNFIYLDSFHIDFQRNNHKWNEGDVKLQFLGHSIPGFRIPDYFKKEDSIEREDTSVIFETEPPARRAGFNSMKQLKTIVIKESYRDHIMKLNNKYCQGTEIAPYNFDLVHEPDPYVYDIMGWMRKNVPGFHYNLGLDPSPGVYGISSPLMFFIDGERVRWQDFDRLSLVEIAYVKCIPDFQGEDDPFQDALDSQANHSMHPMFFEDATSMAPTPIPSFQGKAPPPSDISKVMSSMATSKGPDLTHFAVFMYSRHREDWWLAPTNLNQVILPGFAKILHFNPNGDKRWTLYWNPHQENKFKIHFTNNMYTKHFRITIEGIDQKGDFIHYDKVIPEEHE